REPFRAEHPRDEEDCVGAERKPQCRRCKSTRLFLRLRFGQVTRETLRDLQCNGDVDQPRENGEHVERSIITGSKDPRVKRNEHDRYTAYENVARGVGESVTNESLEHCQLIPAVERTDFRSSGLSPS